MPELMEFYKDLHIVVLSHNRPDRIMCLVNDLLVPAANLGIEITIVDNASEIETVNFLKTIEHTNIKKIFNIRNLGVPTGRNQGFKNSSRCFHLSLDDDSMMELSDLDKLRIYINMFNPPCILALNVVGGIDSSFQNPGRLLHPVANFHGAGHLIPEDIFRSVGYLDEKLFFGGEELEFSMRARLIKRETILVPVKVRHFNLIRERNVRFNRMLNWAESYSTVLFRYLPFLLASLFMFRLFLSYSYSSIRYGAYRLDVLFYRTVIGMLSGLSKRTCLPKNYIMFYTSPDLLPDYGNIPLVMKLKNKISRLYE